jgi:[protein-PII] uridylyltransferase
LFDYQRDLALQLGFVDEQGNMAVEQFMQEYFRTVMKLERFNERLLQSFEEDILLAEEAAEAQPLGSSFVLLKGYLQATDDDIFRRTPVTIIELFELLQQHPEIKGVRAATARALRRSLDVVDEEFRADPNIRQRFIALLRARGDVPGLLARMHRYGVLGRYLPAFGLIEGRMQYDLFHVYTVDQHTLFVLRNLYRFASGGSNVEAFPLVTEIHARLPRPELLYLGGFFHDIAKGRGGDHSQLGETDAAVFCSDHGLSESHTALVCWLVRNHLLMSVTAQRQDISDPEVVNRFAREVGNLLYLDYLYLLTLADISATSPKLWNSWKAALLSDLYRLARQAIQRGLGNPVRRSQWIEDSRREARAQLLDSGMDSGLLDRLWLHLPDEYFLRVSVEQIVWQTGEMASADGGTTVGVRRKTDRGTTEVFVHADNVDGTFATIVATLGLLDLNIVDARVFNTGDEWVMDTFQVLDQRGQSLDDPGRAERIATALAENLAVRPLVPPCQRRELPRRLSHFVRAPVIAFSPARDDPRTMMELNCSDRPGLLARVAEVLLENGVRVHGARIATFGERVEDYFLLSDGQDAPLDADTEQVLASAMQARLGEGMPAALDSKDTDP